MHRGLSVFTDAIPEASWHAGLVRVPSGDAEFTAIDHARNRIIAEVEATTASTIAFHQFMFPGWRATVDGVPVPVAAAPYDDSIHAALGYMVVGLMAVAWRRRRPLAGWARSLQPTSARMVAVGMSVTVIEAIALGAWGGRSRPATTALVARIIPAVAQERVASRTPAGSGTGPMPPILEIRRPTISGDTRPFLFMHLPSDVTVTLEVPSNAYLQAGLACLVETWETDYGDGVRFRAEVSGPSGTHPHHPRPARQPLGEARGSPVDRRLGRPRQRLRPDPSA